MYFDKCGKINTKVTIELAVKVAKEKGINYIVVASTAGDTAKMLKDCGINIVVVTHVNGFKQSGIEEMPEKAKSELESYGFKVYTGTHVLSGAERSLSNKFGGISQVEIIAYSLRMLGQGVKVCVEIATMALDGGMVPYGEDIISIGGTGCGADSAIILRPAHGANILETKIKEIICKPRQW